MIGLVLWHNPVAQVAMIWCEDQGPLAFLGPDVALPAGIEALNAGDQVTFSIELREDVRFVRDVYQVEAGRPGIDPAEILAGAVDRQEAARRLSIVA